MAEHVTSEESELYALGVLDGDEKKVFEAHLLACPDCTRGVASAHQRVALIGLACVPETPRPAVREKIMRRILAERAGNWTQEKTEQIAELRVEREPEPQPAPAAKPKAKPEPVMEPEPEPVAELVGEAPARRVHWLAAGLAALLLAGATAGVWVMHRSHPKQMAQVQQPAEGSQSSQANPVAQSAQPDANLKTISDQKNKPRADGSRLPAAADPATAVAEEPAATPASQPETLSLAAPSRISAGNSRGDAAPPPSLAMGADLGADRSGLPALPGESAEPKVEPAGPSGPLRVSSGVAAARLISPIQPAYPDIAREAHIQGSVVVEATISTTGHVRYVHVLSGPALLTGAAMAAVQRARFRPFILNGAPVEAETTITLVFKLD